MADPKQLASLLSEEEELRRFNAAQGEQPWYSKALPMEGRATFLPFRDTMEGSVFNKREVALPGLLAGALNAFTSPARALTGSDPTFKPGEEAANMALNMFGGGIATGKALTNPTGIGGTDLALNVYHGTPHEIKGGFDLAKVGTGEGAQAYGHGMYFAENPVVAQQYQKDISRSQLMKGGDPVRLDQTISGKPLTNFYESISTKADRMPYEKAAVEYEKMSFIEDLMQGTQFKDAIARIDNPSIVTWAKSLESSYKPAGNLYKADIPDAAIPMMLDWDKPVSKELLARITPENLGLKVKQFDDGLGYVTDAGVLVTRVKQGKAKEVTEEMLKNSFNDSLNRYSTSGQNLYGWIVPGNAPEASQILSNAGITGIKYLDEGSRNWRMLTPDESTTGKYVVGKWPGGGAEQKYFDNLADAQAYLNKNKTSNFVSFQPETVNILEKNAVPVTRKELLQQEFDKLSK